MTVSDEKLEPGRENLRKKFNRAFAIGDEYGQRLKEDEEQLLQDIANNIHRRKLTVAAIPFLIFNKPLNMIGANFLQMGELVFSAMPVEVFLRRFLGPNYTHERLVRTLEKRCALDRLVELLENMIDEGSREESS